VQRAAPQRRHPVSSGTPHVRIGPEDFDVGVEMAALRADDPAVGAVASFVGTVRDRSGAGPADTTRMELEHYPGMTERAIEAMVDEAFRRFRILGARVIHRVGSLAPGEQIVLVVVTSSHRHDAFSACEFLMDYLKTQAPFWKKEHRSDGSAEWVDARVADDAALARWGLTSDNAASSA
jgi:molybdopterin synthase catalytic subunit